MNKTLKNYIAPTLTVVTFKVERGFAESNLPETLAGQVNMILENELNGGESMDNFSSNNLEGYTGHSEWGNVSEGNHFFE